MIGRLYILGVRRARVKIPELEIRQMVGRCGRSYTESGEAVLIASSEDAGYAEKCLYEQPPPISSRMWDLETASFAFLPHIRESGASQREYDSWASRSLASVQGKAPSWSEMREHLLESGAVSEVSGRLHQTIIGRLSSRYYYPVSRVRGVCEKMEAVHLEGGFSNAASMSWILAYDRVFCLEEDIWVEEYRSELSSERIRILPEELADGYAYWCMFQNRRPVWVRSAIDAKRRDLPRLLALCRELSREKGYGCENELLTWEAAGTRRLPYEAAALCREFPGATNSNILELHSDSLHNMKEVDQRWDSIEGSLSPGLRNYLYGKRNCIQDADSAEDAR